MNSFKYSDRAVLSTYYAQIEKMVYITFSKYMPLTASTGRYGVAAVDLNMTWTEYENVINNYAVGEYEYAYLVDQEGTVIRHSKLNEQNFKDAYSISYVEFNVDRDDFGDLDSERQIKYNTCEDPEAGDTYTECQAFEESALDLFKDSTAPSQNLTFTKDGNVYLMFAVPIVLKLDVVDKNEQNLHMMTLVQVYSQAKIDEAIDSIKFIETTVWI